MTTWAAVARAKQAAPTAVSANAARLARSRAWRGRTADNQSVSTSGRARLSPMSGAAMRSGGGISAMPNRETAVSAMATQPTLAARPLRSSIPKVWLASRVGSSRWSNRANRLWLVAAGVCETLSFLDMTSSDSVGSRLRQLLSVVEDGPGGLSRIDGDLDDLLPDRFVPGGERIVSRRHVLDLEFAALGAVEFDAALDRLGEGGTCEQQAKDRQRNSKMTCKGWIHGEYHLDGYFRPWINCNRSPLKPSIARPA